MFNETYNEIATRIYNLRRHTQYNDKSLYSRNDIIEMMLNTALDVDYYIEEKHTLKQISEALSWYYCIDSVTYICKHPISIDIGCLRNIAMFYRPHNDIYGMSDIVALKKYITYACDDLDSDAPYNHERLYGAPFAYTMIQLRQLVIEENGVLIENNMEPISIARRTSIEDMNRILSTHSLRKYIVKMMPWEMTLKQLYATEPYIELVLKISYHNDATCINRINHFNSAKRNRSILPEGTRINISPRILDGLGIECARIGTDAKGDCFFASLLTAIDDGFLLKPSSVRNSILHDLRNSVAKYLFTMSIDDRDKLYSLPFDFASCNILHELNDQNNTDIHLTMSQSEIYERLKTHIATSGTYVGEEMYPIVARYFNINIFVLINSGNAIYNQYNKREIVSYFDLSRSSVILIYNKEHRHYETVGVWIDQNTLITQLEANSTVAEILFDIVYNNCSP